MPMDERSRDACDCCRGRDRRDDRARRVRSAQDPGRSGVTRPPGAPRRDPGPPVASASVARYATSPRNITGCALAIVGPAFENLYTMFYEVIDGKIATQVEMLDFRVAADKFDLSALPPRGLISRPTADTSRRRRS